MLRRRLLPLSLFVLATALRCLPASAAETGIRVSVQDQSNQPVPGARVEVRPTVDRVIAANTDPTGGAQLNLAPGSYRLTVTKDGFEPVEKPDVAVSQSGIAAIAVTLTPAIQRQSVQVESTVSPVEQGSSPPADVPPPQSGRDLPSRPATVSDILPLIPGVARSPGGGLQISGAGEHRSALIVNSADVTDPATGQFGLTVPIDSVETLNVFQTPFLAEYGRFSAGLVSVETRRGGEKWKWDLNDPFPEFRIRSYQLRGLRDATPRLNVDGPLIPGKLYFSEGIEYTIHKTEVYTLPFPNNQKKQEGVNSFAQFDWIASAKQLVTATVHIAPQRLDFVNINYFNPVTTSPDASTHNYTATVADHLTLGGGLFENTLSYTRFDGRVWGKGPLDLVIAPGGNSGNYFAQQDRDASRVGLTSVYALPNQSAFGTHSVKVGSYVAGSSDKGQVEEHAVEIRNAGNQLLETIAFIGGRPFRQSDAEYAFFGQDHWILSSHFAMDLGVRAESQELSETFRVAPRGGFAWSPFGASTVIRGGFGLFYDRVPLNVYSFNSYPNQVITQYGADGQISAGPFVYANDLGEVATHPPFVFQRAVAGNFSPRSANWNLQVEHNFGRLLKLRTGYTQDRSDGLVVLNTEAPDPVTRAGSYLLSGSGQSRYRQFETTARLRLGESRQLFFSYVRSRARGDLNDFSNFLGSFPVPVIRSNQFGNLPTDLPNRFLAWGLIQLPWDFRISPVIEYRSGFPYTVTDALQNYSGVPNLPRFPGFISVDSRISKDFKVNPKYKIRLSVSGYNLTNHFNPEAVHSNTGDPANGLFFGHRGRRFTADFDVIF